MVRVLIVEDHEVVRIGLMRVFESDDSIEIVGEAGTRAAAQDLALEHQPDVVLLDMRLPDGSGVEACRKIREVAPDAKVLILTSFPEKKSVTDALAAGAIGYMLKDSAAPEIRDAVHSVASGKYLLDPEAMSSVMGGPANEESSQSGRGDDLLTRLTGREREILHLIGEGKTNQSIADELCLSLQTVKNYVSTLLTKLGMSRRSEAAAFIARMSVEAESGR